jgi:hypothetical protein
MKTNRFTLMACAAISALVFGCGEPEGKPWQFTTADGDTVQCDSTMGPYEERYVGAPGYDPDGCTLTERMAHVMAFADEESDISGEQNVTPQPMEGELGKLRQPITIPFGLGLAVQNFGTGNALRPANPGHCDQLSSWTTALPLRGECLIPNGVSRIHWEVWPGYGINVQYMRDRMKSAWSAWSRSITCGGVTKQWPFQSSDNSEQPLFTNENDRYNTAAISVFPVQDGPNTQFGARTEVGMAIAKPRTPVRFGIRYWGWDYLPIAVNNFVIEGFKLDACVALNDPKRATKLQHAYEYILAHELGHAFGLPHLTVGIMKPSNQTDCSAVYTTDSLISKMSAVERVVVNQSFDSDGFSEPLSGPFPLSCTTFVDALPQDRDDFE